MAKARKLCFDRLLHHDLNRTLRTRAYQRIDGSMGDRAISLIGKQWVNGTTITVRFVGGDQRQQDMLRDIAPEWTRHANLRFEFTDDPTAQIRITFDPDDGAWSYVGTDNLGIPLHAATLNLGWQDEGVILHEFGHMIGLSHEHQNPQGGISWNEAKVIADLAGPPNFWTEQQTRHNVLEKYGVDQLHGTDFDPDSIMLYAFPADWTIDGFSTHDNQKLSTLDKQFVESAQMYPRVDQPSETVLDVVEAEAGAIGSPGEVDVFTFKITQTGSYTVQTLGTTDVYMSLLGPDTPTRPVAEDDDSGGGRNALVTAELAPGKYFVRVRHFSDSETGHYRVLVSS